LWQLKILFNADDFGLTKGVTDGIVKSHLNGVVKSTTLMMNGLAVDYAIRQAQLYPTLKVGIHLVLTWGKPISNYTPALVDADGFFKYDSGYVYMPYPNLNQVEKEWESQIKAFIATGLTLHHIDSHHHIHGWEPLKNIVIKLARKYNVPVRYAESLKAYPDILLTDTLYTGFYGEGISDQIFEKLKTYHVNSIEVMTHPAYVDEELSQVSSYIKKREKELEILCNLIVPSWATIN